jgi:hypothetical protein
MANATLVCECERGSDPLCGFCDDDLYCPQCGSEITSVFSEDAQPETGVIWIYPQKTGEWAAEFVFSLSLSCRGADRQSRDSYPHLDLVESSLDDQTWFEQKIEELGPRADKRAMCYRLKPKPHWVALGRHWYNSGLPTEGVRVKLYAKGGFEEKQFELRVCRPPNFTIRFSGNGILDSDAIDGNEWDVWKRDKLHLELSIEATTAPVYLDQPVETLELDGTVSLKLENPLKRGEELHPGKPVKLHFTVDSSDWETDDEKEVSVRLPIGCLTPQQERHILRMVALGNLRFSADYWLKLPPMHYGDLLRSNDPNVSLAPLTVLNDGEAPIYVFPPSLEADPIPAEKKSWIEVSWANRGSREVEDGPRLLQVSEREELQVTIDLRKLPEGSLPPNQELRATIELRDDLRKWTLPVLLPSVSPRPPCDRRLAIDFGSTNTYAAIRSASGTVGQQQVVPVLTKGDPEKFESVIFLRVVSDRERPDYVVGPEAARLGQALPTAMVSGLKRWIGVRDEHGRLPELYVLDQKSKDAKFDVPTLVRFMLRDIIRQCDDTLKEKVEKIGISFPANLGVARIRALTKIVDALAEEFARESPPRSFDYAEPKLDEANAVALGFALDPIVQETLILPRMTADNRSVVVGSFDFGGGTIDTALIRIYFDYKNRRIHFSTYRSEYLGIGGDENFGGENVTLAVFELLQERLDAILQEAADGTGAGPGKIVLARPGEQANVAARINFDALWSAAEQVKIHLCKPAVEDSDAHWLAEHLNLKLNRVQGQFSRTASQARECELFQDANVRPHLERALQVERLLVSLDEVYQHRIRNDLRGHSGYTVIDRVRKCVEELVSFAVAHKSPVDFVVLAGAACRLPLVEALMAEKLPETQVVFDPHHAKSKVAFGLVRYLELEDAQPDRVEGLCLSANCTRQAIGVLAVGTHVFEAIVPACSRVDDPKHWYACHDLALQDVWHSKANRRLDLYRLERNKAVLIGSFDLNQSAATNRAAAESPKAKSSSAESPNIEPQGMESALPADFTRENSWAIRFCGSEDHIQLKVEHDGRCYGYWSMIPADEPRRGESAPDNAAASEGVKHGNR